jgi:hypothetical protein
MRTLGALAACLLLTSAVHAQIEGQATIVGVVTDESGAVLPGVTVTASSPSLQVPEVTVVTDARGAYRLGPVPIGMYSVSYSLSGFQTLVRDALRLTAGFTASVDVVMKVGSVQESVTVTGGSPVVDVASTKTVTALTREALELIPTSRNGVQAVLAQAPGIRSNLDVGGNTAGAIPEMRAYGSAVGAWPVIEGIPVGGTASQSDNSGIYIDYESLEEAVVSPMANTAETPTRGVMLTLLVKSGGNEYHGGVHGANSPTGLVASNVDDTLRAQGIDQLPIIRRADGGGDLGGRIVRDKLWFYGGARYRVNKNAVPDACYKPDGSVCTGEVTQSFWFQKTTYQMTPSHRLLAYYQYNTKDNIARASAFIPWGSHGVQEFAGNMGKVEWQGTFGNNILVNALGGLWNLDSFNIIVNPTTSTFDIVTQQRSGADSSNLFPPSRFEYFRKNVSASLTWFARDFAGDHNIRIAADFLKGGNRLTGSSRGEYGDYLLRFSNGAPFQIQIYNNPVRGEQLDRYFSTSVTDRWTVNSRLTVSLGVRMALDQAYVPAQSREAGSFPTLWPAASFPRIDVATWNTIVPRLHASYDVTGDRKTVIKTGYGRFAALRGSSEAAYVNQLARSAMTFRWRDSNANRDYDAGEVNLDRSGPDFVSADFGLTAGVLNLDERPTMTDEVTLSLERELYTGVAARLTSIYARDTNVVQVVNPLVPYEAYTIPVTSPDPGPDGVVGNADDPGTIVTYWEYPVSYRGLLGTTRVNDRRRDRSFKSVEVAVSRRLSNRWQAMGSFSLTEIDDPAPTANPNQEIFGANNTTEWTAKLSGSYQLPYGLLGSVNYILQQGAAWQRTALLRGGLTIPTIVVPMERLGARRLDNIHLLDGRIRKAFRFAGQQVAVGLDVFNLLNVNTITAVSNQSGPRFGFSTSQSTQTTNPPFIPGRNVQLNASYTF